jgi:hypothetical protein
MNGDNFNNLAHKFTKPDIFDDSIKFYEEPNNIGVILSKFKDPNSQETSGFKYRRDSNYQNFDSINININQNDFNDSSFSQDVKSNKYGDNEGSIIQNISINNSKILSNKESFNNSRIDMNNSLYINTFDRQSVLKSEWKNKETIVHVTTHSKNDKNKTELIDINFKDNKDNSDILPINSRFKKIEVKKSIGLIMIMMIFTLLFLLLIVFV